jgi:hypothetical protein
MTNQWMPENKNELMSAIEREWQMLMDVISKLNEKQLNTLDEGGWLPKDNLAHLGEWMNVLIGYHMDNRPPHEVLGVPQEVTKEWDMNVINPVLFERNRNRSATDVLDGVKHIYITLIEKLKSTPFEELMKPRHADDPEKIPLLNWVIGDTTEHFAEHREIIEKLVK